MGKTPEIGILGAGIFVRTQYIPRLSEISDLVSLKFIWSRSEVLYDLSLSVSRTCPETLTSLVRQESARGAVEIARKHFPDVECKWGDQGLDDILEDQSILGVAVVLAGQAQVTIPFSLICPCFLLCLHFLMATLIQFSLYGRTCVG